MEVLERRSPKTSEEQITKAPQTKSTQLITMINDLRDIVELKDMKIDAIKMFTKETKEELEKSVELKKHEADVSAKLKEVIAKNNDLITKMADIVRIDETSVMFQDKTFPQITELEKLSVEDKTKYDMLKKDIEQKTKEMQEIVAKVTRVADKANKIRFVIMKTATKVVSGDIKSNIPEDRLDLILDEYNQIDSILNDVVAGIKSFIKSIGDWFSGLFKE